MSFRNSRSDPYNVDVRTSDQMSIESKFATNKTLSIGQRTSDQITFIKACVWYRSSNLNNSTSGDYETYSAPSDPSRTAQINL